MYHVSKHALNVYWGHTTSVLAGSDKFTLWPILPHKNEPRGQLNKKLGTPYNSIGRKFSALVCIQVAFAFQILLKSTTIIKLPPMFPSF
jgi:hypothetical protein